MAEANFQITGDNSQLLQKLQEIRGEVQKTAVKAKESGNDIDKVFDKIKNAAAAATAAFSAKELVQKIMDVRGEFQQLEMAFTTMLGSADKANALMNQLVQTAATTPFDLQGVANGAKQLLAYGIAAEDVNDTLIRCGDVAAGLSIPLNDLVFLYGTTMVQGRMFTQDLRQFQGRGIPIAEELANVLGTTTQKLGDMVTAGKVTSDVFQKAFMNMTAKGSKFGGLMEAQSQTISGQISNIEDALDMMFNDLGKESEGVINTALSGVSYVVENYEQFGRILLGVVSTYGIYKAACMTVVAIQNLVAAGIGSMTTAEAIHYGWLVLQEKAQKLLNATMLNNPYVLVATAVAAVVTVLISMKTETERVAEATEEYEKKKQEIIDAEEEHRRKINELCDAAANESMSTDERRDALNELEKAYPSIFAKYDSEAEKLKNIKKIKEEIAALDKQNSITLTANELDKVTARIKELQNKRDKIIETEDSESGMVMKTKLGLTSAENDELKSLLKQQATLIKKRMKEKTDAYFSDLSKLSDSQLKQMKQDRNDLLYKLRNNKNGTGYTTNDPTEIKGSYTKDELQYQLNKINNELTKRSAPKKSGAERGADARKAYEEARKAYNDFISNSVNKMTDEEYEKRRDELKSALDEAKKEADKYKTVDDKNADKRKNKEEKQKEKEQKEREKQKEAQQKLAQELLEMQIKNDDNEIALMEESNEKKLSEIQNAYDKQNAAIKKQREAWVKENKKARNKVGSDGLTDEQRKELQRAELNNQKDFEKQKEDLEKGRLLNELQAMSDYLQQYGTLEEQKYAIAKLYAEKIKEVEKSGDSEETKRWKIRSLQKEQASMTSAANAQSLAMGIDWSSTFNGVGKLLKDIAKETLTKVEEYIKSDEFKTLSVTDKKTYTDLRSTLRDQSNTNTISIFKTSIWGDISKSAKKYQDAVKLVQQRTEEHSRALTNLKLAEADLANATDDNAKKMAQTNVNIAKSNVETTGHNLENAQTDESNAHQDLTNNVEKATNGLNNFANVLSTMSKGSLSGFANGISMLVTSLRKGSNGVGKSLSELGKVGGIVGAILQVLEAMGDDPGKFFDELLNSIADTVEALFEHLPELLWQIIKDAGNIVKGVFEGIASWFHVDDLFGLKGNAKEVEKKIKELTSHSDLLKDSIDTLTDEMKNYTGYKSTEAFVQARNNQAEINKDLLEAAKAQASYWKNRHSWNYYWEGLSSEQIAWARKNVKENFTGDIWTLTPEEMKKLLTNVSIAEKIRQSGKDDFGVAVFDKLKEYADQADKIKDLTDQWRESIMQVSFDTMKDNFVSALMDMDKSARDFTDDFSEMIQRALLQFAISDIMDNDLKRFYESITEEVAASGDELTAERIEFYRQWENEIAKKGLAERDRIAEITGYDKTSQQSGDSGGFESMTQETAEELSGRFTALQVTAQNTRIDVMNILNKLDTSIAISTVRNTMLQEVVNLMNRSTSFLEDIAADARKMRNEFGEKFDEMNKYLKAI